jgi:hypothetical protein
MDLHTLVVSNDEQHRRTLRQRIDRAVVSTPLDMIAQLEGHREIDTVVLAGTFATPELATFLLDFYPSVRVIDGHTESDPDTYLPVYG